MIKADITVPTLIIAGIFAVVGAVALYLRKSGEEKIVINSKGELEISPVDKEDGKVIIKAAKSGGTILGVNQNDKGVHISEVDAKGDITATGGSSPRP